MTKYREIIRLTMSMLMMEKMHQQIHFVCFNLDSRKRDDEILAMEFWNSLGIARILIKYHLSSCFFIVMFYNNYINMTG